MSIEKKLEKILETAQQVYFDDSSKIIIMSDCHRGNGSWADDFLNNQNLYFAALTYYFSKNYTYIELGDGDELWKNKNMVDIINVHKDAFWILSNFLKENRAYFLYGNHDMVKKYNKYVKKNLYNYFDERRKKVIPLFEDVNFHEGLVLNYKNTNKKLLLIHGHQASFMDYEMWRCGRFLVRYLWRPLELLGVNDPTSTAKNYKKKDWIEQSLIEWVKKKKQVLIAGHTHRPMFPEVGDIPYFNDGSCIHPRCITGIEIVEGSIQLIKWCVKIKSDGTMFVGREVLAGPRKLIDYFSNNKR